MKYTLILLIIIFLGVIYLYFPIENRNSKDNISLESDYNSIQVNQSKVDHGAYTDQFNDTTEYHWNHMPVTYNLDSCNITFEGKMKIDIVETLKYISNKTDNAITFKEARTSENPDITYICDIGGIKTKRNRGHGPEANSIVQAEAVPYEYEGTKIYAPGIVYIYSTYECLGQRPTLIIHETLHLFSLVHKSPYKTWDVMQPFLTDKCDLELINEDIKYLKEIYDKE